MALTVGTNSWVTVIEADNYLSDKFGADGWSALSNNVKEQCLVTAFWWLYTYPGLNVPKTSTNEKIKTAQIELAWWVYNNYPEFEKRGVLIASGVEDFTLSKWKEKLGKQDLPYFILNLIFELLTDTGGFFPTFNRDLEN